ncbi:MAG TPA: acyl-CoA dehydrogenase family protein [Gaiellaceae bacterium]|nr:acyl-CoA dehydrogenase family protein [Gaiellaceae bacterium]
MDFSFTEEQQELKSQARSYLAERFPSERVAELADSDAGWDPASWHELAELGWLGVSVPEEQGGAGLGFVEEALLLEELGRALYPGPYFSTVALALPLLGEEDVADVVAGKVRWSASLEGSLVPDLAIVDRVAVVEDGDARAVDARGETLDTTDSTRRLGRLEAQDGTPLPGDVSRLRARVLAAAAAEAVGIGERVLEIGIEHAKTRQQFGKAIGTYQAVSHSLADSYVGTQLARSLAYWAAWCVSVDDSEAPVAAAAAKSFATDAAVAACERTIQVLGGIGFTWEHILHRYYKRTLQLQSFAGYGATHRSTVARHLLGAPAAV